MDNQLTNIFTSIANNIRSKLKSSDKIKPDSIESLINKFEFEYPIQILTNPYADVKLSENNTSTYTTIKADDSGIANFIVKKPGEYNITIILKTVNETSTISIY